MSYKTIRRKPTSGTPETKYIFTKGKFNLDFSIYESDYINHNSEVRFFTAVSTASQPAVLTSVTSLSFKIAYCQLSYSDNGGADIEGNVLYIKNAASSGLGEIMGIVYVGHCVNSTYHYYRCLILNVTGSTLSTHSYDSQTGYFYCSPLCYRDISAPASVYINSEHGFGEALYDMEGFYNSANTGVVTINRKTNDAGAENVALVVGNNPSAPSHISSAIMKWYPSSSYNALCILSRYGLNEKFTNYFYLDTGDPSISFTSTGSQYHWQGDKATIRRYIIGSQSLCFPILITTSTYHGIMIPTGATTASSNDYNVYFQCFTFGTKTNRGTTTLIGFTIATSNQSSVTIGGINRYNHDKVTAMLYCPFSIRAHTTDQMEDLDIQIRFENKGGCSVILYSTADIQSGDSASNVRVVSAGAIADFVLFIRKPQITDIPETCGVELKVGVGDTASTTELNKGFPNGTLYSGMIDVEDSST